MERPEDTHASGNAALIGTFRLIVVLGVLVAAGVAVLAAFGLIELDSASGVVVPVLIVLVLAAVVATILARV